jgi:plastocyanin
MAVGRVRIAGALAAALLVAGCTSTSESHSTSEAPSSEAGSLVVVVGDNEFTPDALEVAAGDTVVWDFDPARRPHDVSFLDDPSRASGVLDDGSWSTSFDEPGTYPYECTLHSGMDGQVVVTDG